MRSNPNPSPNPNINYYGNNPTYANNYDPTKTDNMNNSVNDDPLKHLEDGLLGQARKKFIMKVYLILTGIIFFISIVQLLITVGMCFISFYVPSFMMFQYNTNWLMWVLLVVMIVI